MRHLKMLRPKLKYNEYSYYNEDSILVTGRFSYMDYNDLEEIEVFNYLENEFDEGNNLINSIVEGSYGYERRFLMYELNYKYYKNGLLKSIRGYDQMFFKYAFWKYI